MAFTVDTEKVKQKIAFIRDKIREDANPQLLNEYRLLLKKGIPLFRRSWAAAYLLMLYDQGQSRPNSHREKGEGFRTKTRGPIQGENPRGFSRDNGGDRRNRGAPAEAASGPADKFILTEEESKRLFISIGRNRRLFPREILGLIINAAKVEREDIGSIRILDNYSFVQVRDTVADKIIDALNGTLFRGRTLAVNYAHAKREGGAGDREAADGDEPQAEEEPGEEPQAWDRPDAVDEAGDEPLAGDEPQAEGGPEAGGEPEDGPEAGEEAAPEAEAPDLTLAAEQGDDSPDEESV